MPYNYELTWIPRAKKWRKRYKGETYYLITKTNGKRDRKGYQDALREWERLKAYLDGLGPYPYTDESRTRSLIPESQVIDLAPKYAPPVAEVSPAPVHTIGVETKGPRNLEVNGSLPRNGKRPEDPKWIQSVGVDFSFLRPEMALDSSKSNPYDGERRISALAEFWLDQRRKETERGELSKGQWYDDTTKLKAFRDFLKVNFPKLVYFDDITPAVLNLYRDKSFELLESKEHKISKVTLKKRLSVVGKWFNWLVDQNIIDAPPKDLRTFARVKLDPPKPKFWTVDEIKTLVSHANKRNRLYLMLALNLGYTQQDISSLENSMIDWQTGIVTRERHKTGVPTKAKLWTSTLELLKKNRAKGNLALLNANGKPLLQVNVNQNGHMSRNDTIRLAFRRLQKRAGFESDSRSFKHLRKSAANEIEKTRPDLTGLFLGHSEKQMKRHYVSQHFEELFNEVDKLEDLFFPVKSN